MLLTTGSFCPLMLDPKAQSKGVGALGAGRPDFGGRWPRGEALGKRKRVACEVLPEQTLDADLGRMMDTATELRHEVDERWAAAPGDRRVFEVRGPRDYQEKNSARQGA